MNTDTILIALSTTFPDITIQPPPSLLDDPAQDFARAVINHYRVVGGAVDLHLMHRWERRWQVRELAGVCWSIVQNDADELAESIAKVRRGAILG